jgi:hypothetical protein
VPVSSRRGPCVLRSAVELRIPSRPASQFGSAPFPHPAARPDRRTRPRHRRHGRARSGDEPRREGTTAGAPSGVPTRSRPRPGPFSPLSADVAASQNALSAEGCSSRGGDMATLPSGRRSDWILPCPALTDSSPSASWASGFEPLLRQLSLARLAKPRSHVSGRRPSGRPVRPRSRRPGRGRPRGAAIARGWRRPRRFGAHSPVERRVVLRSRIRSAIPPHRLAAGRHQGPRRASSRAG